MKKIAYRDCRKDALDIHKLTEQEHLELNLAKQQLEPDPDDIVRDPLLYNFITSPKINNGLPKPVLFKVKKNGKTVISHKMREVDSYKTSLDPPKREISASPRRSIKAIPKLKHEPNKQTRVLISTIREDESNLESARLPVPDSSLIRIQENITKFSEDPNLNADIVEQLETTDPPTPTIDQPALNQPTKVFQAISFSDNQFINSVNSSKIETTRSKEIIQPELFQADSNKFKSPEIKPELQKRGRKFYSKNPSLPVNAPDRYFTKQKIKVNVGKPELFSPVNVN